MKLKEGNKKAQITIFIIIGIIIIGAVISFFAFRDKLITEQIPASIEPIYNTFLSCLEDNTLTGIDILESQAGYIYLPDFEPGSSYMPFSSQLNFLGNPIPYWYYVSGNNIQKTQMPSVSNMENDLNNFIEEKINNCIFDSYYAQGFEIIMGDSEAKTDIREKEIEIDLAMNLEISNAEDSALIQNHNIIIKTELGALYNSAKQIYEKEQSSLFLENYGIDILRLYAPVDGVEITCSPLTWIADDIFDDLEEAIEANTASLKVSGGDFTLKNKEDKYFVIDLNIEENVRFLNSRDWTNSFEVIPSEESVLITTPVGNQPGLGVLGFCYVPYHFVYNMKYPVLIQVYSEDTSEIFQFPMAVVIQGNNPRKSLDITTIEQDIFKFCEYKNTLIEVNTYDTKLNPVEGNISYECSGTTCEIGKTNEQGNLITQFPQCANGFIRAKAKGYKDAKYSYSTTGEGRVDIILDKLYELDVNLKLEGSSYGGDAIISFISDDFSKTIIYPEQNIVELSEAQYEIQVYVYKNSSIRIEKTSQEQCFEIPQTGLGGLMGLTEEKCLEINLPAQIISNALAGGGKENYYMLESELEESNTIEINAEKLPTPVSLEQLQNNYALFESKGLGINFN